MARGPVDCSVPNDRAKFFQKTFKKMLTIPGKYAIITTVRERRKPPMTSNWYENLEIHDEDYEELLKMLEEYENGNPDDGIVW